MEALPDFATKDGLNDEEPQSEVTHGQDEEDLAAFGKRQQLKV